MRHPSPHRLRILICLLYFVPHRTGLTMYVHRLATELARRGHAVTVLTARHSRDLPREEMLDGVRVVRLAAGLPISRGMVMPGYPWTLWRLLHEHDIVSINTPMLETALVAGLSSLVQRPLVITHHGDLILPSGLMNAFIKHTMYAFYRIAAARASRIVAHSEDYAAHSYYLRPYLHKVTPVLPPIAMPLPDPVRVATWRREWSRDGGPVIGFANRFVEEKRPDVAIKALGVVARTFPNARLVFAGQHRIPYEHTWDRHQALVREYADRLAFVGPFDTRQEMADFYAACDVMALTSDSDCFGLATVESMLCGTPVVATNIPGARVPVMMTGMGRLAERGDPESIGTAIVEVLKDRGAYRRPRADIEQTFSLDRTVEAYEDILRAAMANA